jgi:hypothetical protein
MIIPPLQMQMGKTKYQIKFKTRVGLNEQIRSLNDLSSLVAWLVDKRWKLANERTFSQRFKWKGKIRKGGGENSFSFLWVS